MRKQDKSGKTTSRNDEKDNNNSSNPAQVNNEDWEKKQEKYYMNLLNDLKQPNIDDEEMLDHLDDFRYPPY
ncbi:MAG: hypothetical protein EHM58_08755 [Ignavibacteriae bacterium]|nr:MAG: hypothetical protein EHM58_08755 [Ignavibacteriota bacterium]